MKVNNNLSLIPILEAFSLMSNCTYAQVVIVSKSHYIRRYGLCQRLLRLWFFDFLQRLYAGSGRLGNMIGLHDFLVHRVGVWVEVWRCYSPALIARRGCLTSCWRLRAELAAQHIVVWIAGKLRMHITRRGRCLR